MSKKLRLTIACIVTFCAIPGLLFLIAIQRKWKSSYCHSQCARCGCSRYVEIKLGRRVQDSVKHNEISNWLSGYRTGACQHIWIPIAGWSSSNNLYWDGVSHYNSCLERIRERDPTVGEQVTKQLLTRYDTIIQMEEGQNKDEKFREFCDELKVELH